MFDVLILVAHSEQLLCHRISVAPTQGSQSYPIVIGLEQALRDKFADLVISFRGWDGFSRDTTKKTQTEHKGISLALGCRKNCALGYRQTIVIQACSDR